MADSGVPEDFRFNVHFELKKIDVVKSRGVEVLVVHTSCAIFMFVPGFVIVFRELYINVMAAGHSYELDL
jgi:hypothetical protein